MIKPFTMKELSGFLWVIFERKGPEKGMFIYFFEFMCRQSSLPSRTSTSSGVKSTPGKLSKTPSHRLFSLLQHGKRYRCIKSDTKMLLNSFYPQAIQLINSYKKRAARTLCHVSLLAFYFNICAVSMHTHRALHTHCHSNTHCIICSLTHNMHVHLYWLYTPTHIQAAATLFIIYPVA